MYYFIFNRIIFPIILYLLVTQDIWLKEVELLLVVKLHKLVNVDDKLMISSIIMVKHMILKVGIKYIKLAIKRIRLIMVVH